MCFNISSRFLTYLSAQSDDSAVIYIRISLNIQIIIKITIITRFDVQDMVDTLKKLMFLLLNIICNKSCIISDVHESRENAIFYNIRFFF